MGYRVGKAKCLGMLMLLFRALLGVAFLRLVTPNEGHVGRVSTRRNQQLQPILRETAFL